MNILIRLIIVALAAVFSKFKLGYGVVIIILFTFISLFSFFAAYADYTFGEPSWIIRNEIIFGISASIVGWALGLALIRQAKARGAMMAANLDEYERKRDCNGS